MCGIIGIIGKENISNSVKLGLQAVQHRGQDAAGIGVVNENCFFVHKDPGYVVQALEGVDVKGPGVAIGHVRYPTAGMGAHIREDAQPFFCRQPGVVMVHNGNLTNCSELKKYLGDQSIYLSTGCDLEPLLYIFCDKLMKIRSTNHGIDDVVAALKETYKLIRGAFTIVAGLVIRGKPTMFCARDPYGIRPAVWGRTKDGYVCASESVSIDILDSEHKGDVGAGEVMFFREDEEPKSYLIDKKGIAPCVFESIYFARPDSIINNNSVYKTRLELGKKLGQEILSKNINVDIVSPVPDTSIPAALSIADTIGKPYAECFIKNRYSARTFIMPTQVCRENAVRLKLNPIVSQIEGKKLLLVDDSIVRGTTLKRVVSLLKTRGKAKEVHLAIHCPPVLNPCFYGIDMSIREDLVAYRETLKLGIDTTSPCLDEQRRMEKQIAVCLGADSLTYLSIDGLNSVAGRDKCAACFDGKYPVQLSDTLIEEMRNGRKGISCACTTS
ncbi:MAG: amidophosphoribosyltransferase [Oligoflexia bacterium]|nr:amidophosphoribosyltransferase [Oligoflexia bacterium]